MILGDRKVNNTTIILYSENDEKFKSDVLKHLQLRDEVTPLDKISSTCLDQTKKFTVHLNQTIKDTTTVICMLSYNFITTEFGLGSYFKKLIEAHNLNRICLIPIYIDISDTSPVRLKKIKKLNNNSTPLIQLDEKYYHQKLADIAQEVASLILEANKFNSKLVNHWERIKSSGSIDEYRVFIEKYKYSRYTERAQLEYDKLLEEKLWKEASSALLNTTENQLYYLTNAPFAKHKKESINKIIEIEESEDVARKDVEKNSNLGILFDYKLKYRETGDINLVNEKIYKILSKSLDEGIGKEEKIETESYKLKYNIFENCSKNELFNYYLFEKSYEKVIKKLNDTQKGLSGKITNIIFVSFLSLFFIFVLSWIDSDLISNYSSYHFIIYAFCFLGIFSVVKAITQIQKELTICKKKLAEIKIKFIELKILFASRNLIGQNNFFLFLFNTEEELHQLSKKSIWSYLLFESNTGTEHNLPEAERKNIPSAT